MRLAVNSSLFPQTVRRCGLQYHSLAAEGRCKDDAFHASMERAPLRRLAIRRFHDQIEDLRVLFLLHHQSSRGRLP
jgi:hypothetical protein